MATPLLGATDTSTLPRPPDAPSVWGGLDDEHLAWEASAALSEGKTVPLHAAEKEITPASQPLTAYQWGYWVVFTPRAVQEAAALPPALRERVMAAIESLSENEVFYGHHPAHEARPRPFYVRVGDCLLLYTVNEPRHTLIIVRVAYTSDGS